MVREGVQALTQPIERGLAEGRAQMLKRDVAGGGTNGRVQGEAKAADPPARESIADETFGERTPSELIAQRRALARRFYEEQGFPPDKINGHLNGIDFSKPVEVVPLKKGTVLEQWNFGSYQGDYYTLPGTDPRTLGIPMERTNNVTGLIEQRTVRQFVVQEDVQALRSTAGNIDWPPYGTLNGGGQQFMTNVKGVIAPKGGP